MWVANGTRPPAHAFRRPGPVRISRPPALLTSTVDPSSIDRFVDQLRTGVWDDESEDLWGGDEDEGDEFPIDDSGLKDMPGVVEQDLAEVRVIGPVEVTGWRHVPQRSVVTELACYLALHRNRPIPGDELRMAIWPDDVREASAKSLRTYMSLLRKCLGSERVPAGSGGGYRIGADVACDWDRFRALTVPSASPDQLHAALELVRGRPFTGVPANSFGWVFSELLVSEMEVAIAEVSRRLSRELVALKAIPDASWAIQQGLRAVPTDFGLWELRLSIAELEGRSELARAQRDAEASLGDAAAQLTNRPGDD